MILFVDACARKGSRTRELAEAVLQNASSDGAEVRRVQLYDLDLKPLTEEVLAKRDEATKKGDFSDEFYDLAKEFSKADTVIIAAPYWDLSFPAILKLYIEHISINGITFMYDASGMPRGLCKGEKLYYVTTSGGEIGAYNFGYQYIKAVSEGLFGIRETVCYRAVGLDMDSVDADKVLSNAKERIAELVH